MTSIVWTRLGLACGFAAISLASPAKAEEGVAFKNLMANMGIISPEKDPIRYRERAPLVLPPKMQLRDPAGPDTLAVNNPQWPKDPDVEAKRKRTAEERTPVTYSETRRMSDNNPRLSIDEMRAGRTSRSEAIDPKLHRGDNARDVLLLSPDEMRSKAKADESASLGDEPDRRALTEPPTGMRRSVNGGRVVAGNAPPRIDQQARDASPIAWLTRKFQSDSDDE